ncbi:MAG: hypothetical protein DDT29_00712 [Dehalococcoidia bacterium]|nr:hypothetical protein [Bacillota bacterium]
MECYAVLPKGGCKILKVKTCKGCAFFRTREQNENSRKAVFARLASLENIQQFYIADKYHGGKMPWYGVEGTTVRGYLRGV